MYSCEEIKKEDLTSENFHWTDYFKSDTARRLGIDNYPQPRDEFLILNNLKNTAKMGQEIRNILNCPVYYNSAYRCRLLNEALPGASPTSDHMEGLALDLTSPDFGTPEDIMKKLYLEGFLVDQCLAEGTWLHVSQRINGTNRMMYGYYLFNPETKKREFKALN